MKYFICLLMLFIFISSKNYAKQDDLYVCAIFKNESRFLDEWITFHLHQGVNKIYLYNNKSEDDYLKVLSPYILSGRVSLQEWPHDNSNIDAWNHTQCSAYMDCIKKVKNKVHWIAFIDTDEFLFSPTEKSLYSVLKKYNDCHAIGVNWVCYGTSNIQYLDKEWLTLKMLYRTELTDPINTHIKSIVRPNKVISCPNPHYFIMRDGYTMVNEQKKIMTGPFHENSVNFIRINHYWPRDLDFFYNEKIPRRRTWGEDDETIIEMENEMNKIYDPIILKNLPIFN